MADTLASVADLGNYVKRDLTGDASATLALETATGLIQDYTGQHLFRVADDVETFHPPGWVLILPERPVISVASAIVDGIALDYRLERRAGVLYLATATPTAETWKTAPGDVVVTYTHGYAATEIPPSLKGVCLDVARRALENPHGFVQRTVGDVSVSHGSHSGLAVGFQLSEREERALAPYRRVA